MATNIKAEAHELIDQVPNILTWEELAYRIEIRALLERGSIQSELGELATQD